jgi:transporter family protein
MPGAWFPYAIAAAILYGLHQIFTKLASERISDGFGALIVEGSATATILVYLAVLYASGRWTQTWTPTGAAYSLLTGMCVGTGTIAFFLLFQRGGPLSAVPAILAGGAAIMAIAGIVWFGEPTRPLRLLGIALSLMGLYLVR